MKEGPGILVVDLKRIMKVAKVLNKITCSGDLRFEGKLTFFSIDGHNTYDVGEIRVIDGSTVLVSSIDPVIRNIKTGEVVEEL